jgi:alkaline phosphatase D
MRFSFPDGELSAWACLGRVTDRSVRVWLRDLELKSHVATVWIDDNMAGEATLEPSSEHDGIAAADVALAQPFPNSRFRVDVAGFQRSGIMAPAPGEPCAFSFAFGSCNQPFAVTSSGSVTKQDSAGIYPAMCRVLKAQQARFVALLGDQVYSDGIPHFNVREVFPDKDSPVSDQELLSFYRHIYRGYFAEKGFLELLQTAPTYMIWDDHEILDNWGSEPDRTEVENQMFRAAAKAFWEYQHLHNPGADLEGGPPYHFKFWYGDVGFMVLDIRSSRDYQAHRVIDEAQWKSFDEFLAEATQRETPTLFIGVTTPVIHFSPAGVRLLDWMPGSKGGNVRDRWDSDRFHQDRDRLLSSLFDWQSEGPERQVVILSGDVHAGAAFRVRRKRGPGEILQWTSSSFTAPAGVFHDIFNTLGTALVNVGEQLCRATRGGVETLNNFGVVNVTPLGRGRGHEIAFTLYGYNPKRGNLVTRIRSFKRPRLG